MDTFLALVCLAGFGVLIAGLLGGILVALDRLAAKRRAARTGRPPQPATH
jgi:hypothetical protein